MLYNNLLRLKIDLFVIVIVFVIGIKRIYLVVIHDNPLLRLDIGTFSYDKRSCMQLPKNRN